MIPQIIHYTWFSTDPIPSEVEACIASWHQYMPEYEYVLWDMERIRTIDSPWLQECLSEHKWAFAADFVRLYAVFHHGGIYLDTDCMLYRSFDSLLSAPAFIGREWTVHHNWHRTHQYLTSHCFGAELGNPFIQKCLSYYEGRHFVTSFDVNLPQELRYDMTILPFIQFRLAEQFGYDSRPSADGKVQRLNKINIYPSDCFDPYEVNSGTYCRHLCLGAWRSVPKPSAGLITFSYRLRYHIDKWLRAIFNRLGYVIIRKD